MFRYPFKRGWITVSTGTPDFPDISKYCQWRAKLRLPMNDINFSDRDVFDIIDWVLRDTIKE